MSLLFVKMLQNTNFPHNLNSNKQSTDISRITALESLAADVTGREQALIYVSSEVFTLDSVINKTWKNAKLACRLPNICIVSSCGLLKSCDLTYKFDLT